MSDEGKAPDTRKSIQLSTRGLFLAWSSGGARVRGSDEGGPGICFIGPHIKLFRKRKKLIGLVLITFSFLWFDLIRSISGASLPEVGAPPITISISVIYSKRIRASLRPSSESLLHKLYDFS